MSLAINEMHQKAMELADAAFYDKMEQKLDSAQTNYLAAFEYESAAAMLMVNDHEHEPTRSVLFRSAACLLLNLPFPEDTHFRQAERMVAYGLSGNPPKEIADELREVWRELIQYFHKEAA